VGSWLSHERNVRVCAVLGAVAIAWSSILVRLSHASPSTAAIFRCAGAVFGLGAGLAYVGFLLLLRRGGADVRRPAGPLFDATLVGAVVSAAAGVVIGDAHLVPTWPGAGWLVVLALTSQVVGWLLISISLPRLAAAQTSLLLTIQPVGSVALAAAIFGESPSALQLGGVVLVLSALLVATTPVVSSVRGRERPQPALE
jgi:drug/metabolite transporter (DMT)-like permease